MRLNRVIKTEGRLKQKRIKASFGRFYSIADVLCEQATVQNGAFGLKVKENLYFGLLGF